LYSLLHFTVATLTQPLTHYTNYNAILLQLDRPLRLVWLYDGASKPHACRRSSRAHGQRPELCRCCRQRSLPRTRQSASQALHEHLWLHLPIIAHSLHSPTQHPAINFFPSTRYTIPRSRFPRAGKEEPSKFSLPTPFFLSLPHSFSQ